VDVMRTVYYGLVYQFLSYGITVYGHWTKNIQSNCVRGLIKNIWDKIFKRETTNSIEVTTM
jgi:hypothetical protein